MCMQLGVIFGTKRRKVGEQEHLAKLFGWLFTYLLLLSEKRGPHATGLALLQSDGHYRLFKRPLRASEFVKDRDFRRVLASVDGSSTLLMGHTRWQTRGDASNNANNHPLRARDVIGTANGTIINADRLFVRLGLERHAEVDSELLMRVADATLDEGRLDPVAIRARLALFRGQLSAVIASRRNPKTVMLIKGNKPLELRYHRGHKAIVYCTDAAYLDVALSGDSGWKILPTVPMSLMTFHCDKLLEFLSEPFRMASPGRGGFRRYACPEDPEAETGGYYEQDILR